MPELLVLVTQFFDCRLGGNCRKGPEASFIIDKVAGKLWHLLVLVLFDHLFVFPIRLGEPPAGNQSKHVLSCFDLDQQVSQQSTIFKRCNQFEMNQS